MRVYTRKLAFVFKSRKHFSLFLSYLCHSCVFVNGHEYFVQQRLEVVSQHPVHDEALQRRHNHVVVLLDRHVEIDQALPEIV